MVRVLLDTNVLISALIREDKPRTLLRLAYKKIYRLILFVFTSPVSSPLHAHGLCDLFV